MSLLLVVFWTAVGAVCLTLALTVAVRVSSEIARRRLARYEGVLHANLTAYVVGVRADPPPAPQGRFEQHVLRRDLVALVPSVKGDAAARLAGLFVACGLVEVARRDLGARGSLTRIRAAEALGAMQVTEAEPWLVAGLGHQDPLLRLACARALADLGATDALARIIAALREVDAEPGDVEEILVAFGSAGVPFLRWMLADGSAVERQLAAVALGYIGSHRALLELRDALGAADDELVAAAARALGRVGDSQATPPLIELLRGARPWFVRVAAASALGALGDRSAAPALVTALESDAWDLRNAAARSLVALDWAGIEAVGSALDTVPDPGVAHFAGLVDVAWRLESIIARAATGEQQFDRFVRRACAVGVHARLDELAAGRSAIGRYATKVLAGSGQGS
jgi:HEAT repeat protein